MRKSIAIRNADVEKLSRACFERIDLNKNGFVCMTELEHFLSAEAKNGKKTQFLRKMAPGGPRRPLACKSSPLRIPESFQHFGWTSMWRSAHT